MIALSRLPGIARVRLDHVFVVVLESRGMSSRADALRGEARGTMTDLRPAPPLVVRQ